MSVTFQAKKIAVLGGLRALLIAAKGIRVVVPSENLGEFDAAVSKLREVLMEARKVNNMEEAEALMEKYQKDFESEESKFVQGRIEYWEQRLRNADNPEQSEKAMAVIAELEGIKERL